MKIRIRLVHALLRVSAAIGLSSFVLAPLPGQAQLNPSDFKNVTGNRIEAFTILGGDYGVSGATFNPDERPDRDTELSVSKFGGWGDIGDPKPLGNTGIRWQPRLQGSMGYLEAKNDFRVGSNLAGDESKFKSYAIQFGGGGRFWFNDHLSLTPTVMGMYGHTENEYTVHNPASIGLVPQAEALGLINWDADTWTVRPAGQLAWVQPWRRTIFTLASDVAYFHTESFRTSSGLSKINGDSETWKNLIDVDVPLGKQLWGHELRTGGYFSRTEFYDGIKSGLNTSHMYEAHGRLVLDFLGKFWKVKWIGIGGSYLWGNNFDGWSVGADVAFRF